MPDLDHLTKDGYPPPMFIFTDDKQSLGNDLTGMQAHSNALLVGVTGLEYGNHSVRIAGQVIGNRPKYLLVSVPSRG